MASWCVLRKVCLLWASTLERSNICLSVQAGCCTMRPPLRQQDGILFSEVLPILILFLLDTFPSQHPTRSPSHPPKQLLQKQPTSSSAFPTAVPPLMHSYRLPEQIPYQTAESASADVQELTSRSLIPILPAETAAASEPAAAADSAPSRSDQSWHGMRNSHHGPGSVSASSQGADDKSLRSTTGESVSNAVMGPASAAAAGSGLAYANSSLPAFRLPPAVGSPYEAFGANPVWVQNVHSQAASWHDSSSLTATPNAVVQVS